MIRVHPEAEAASHAAARFTVRQAREAVEEHDSFGLALAGGSTPRRLYELLATEYRAEIPWPRVQFYWSDERCVPPDDERSNYGIARSMLLDHVPIPATNVHRIRGELGPERAAAEYERILGQADSLDLVLLGLGADGHTASLFPGQLQPTDPRTVRGVEAPAGVEPRARVTLTLRGLEAFTAALQQWPREGVPN
ncbi:MAG: 6-phosphogluconolactonase, partial [Gemmatimonadota bacterium]